MLLVFFANIALSENFCYRGVSVNKSSCRPKQRSFGRVEAESRLIVDCSKSLKATCNMHFPTMISQLMIMKLEQFNSSKDLNPRGRCPHVRGVQGGEDP